MLKYINDLYRVDMDVYVYISSLKNLVAVHRPLYGRANDKCQTLPHAVLFIEDMGDKMCLVYS